MSRSDDGDRVGAFHLPGDPGKRVEHVKVSYDLVRSVWRGDTELKVVAVPRGVRRLTSAAQVIEVPNWSGARHARIEGDGNGWTFHGGGDIYGSK